MLILVCSFVEKLKEETFVVPHLYATNINVIEKECHEGVVRGGGGGIGGEFVTNIIINVVLNNWTN